MAGKAAKAARAACQFCDGGKETQGWWQGQAQEGTIVLPRGNRGVSLRGTRKRSCA